MHLIGDFVIQCSKCGRVYKIDTECLDDESIYIGEGNMGSQFQHEFLYEVECDKCGEYLVAKILGYEYPEGTFEYQANETENCTIVEEPLAVTDYDIPDGVLSAYEQVIYNPDCIYELTPIEFEEFVAEFYRRQGFNVEVTQRTRDGGKDIVATFENAGILYNTYFECKKYSSQNPVDVSIVRQLYGVMEKDRVDKGVIVTTSHFTADAIKEARQFNGRIQLVDIDELKKLIKMKFDMR